MSQTTRKSIVKDTSGHSKLVQNFIDSITASKYLKIEDPSTFIQELCSDLHALKQVLVTHPSCLTLINSLIALLDQREASLPNNYCIYTGRLRAARVLLEIHEKVPEEKYLLLAHRLVKENIYKYSTSPYLSYGLVKGRAGTLAGAMLCSSLFQVEALQEFPLLALRTCLYELYLYRNGLAGLRTDADIRPRCDLAGGSAGLLWMLSSLWENEIIDQNLLRPILSGLVDHTMSAWLPRNKNWASYALSCSDLDQHFLFLNKLKEGSHFFSARKDDFSFWTGSTGIIISLVAYLKLGINRPVSENIETKIVMAEKSLYKHYRKSAPPSWLPLFYMYASLYHYFGEASYRHKADECALHSTSVRERLLMTFSGLNNYDLEVLDVLPSIPKQTLMLPENVSKQFVISLFQKSFPKTAFLINTIDPSILNNLDEKVDLSKKFYKDSLKFIKQALILRGQKSKILRDCINYETQVSGFLALFPNKIHLRTREIAERKKADELLADGIVNHGATVIKSSDTIMLHIGHWNWAGHDRNAFKKNLNEQEAKEHHFVFQAKCVLLQVEEFVLTEAHLLLLQIFDKPLSIDAGLELFFETFELSNSAEQQTVRQFGRDALEYMIYNRFVIPE